MRRRGLRWCFFVSEPPARPHQNYLDKRGLATSGGQLGAAIKEHSAPGEELSARRRG